VDGCPARTGAGRPPPRHAGPAVLVAGRPGCIGWDDTHDRVRTGRAAARSTCRVLPGGRLIPTTGRRRMARGARIAALGSAVCLALGACSAGEGVDLAGAGDLDTDGYLEVAIAGEPDQLDPHNTSAYFSFQILENVYDTLVEPDKN